jgi:hypothetical protein
MTREERRIIRQRQHAYRAAGLTEQKMTELTWEYVTALAANDAPAKAKYAQQLADAHAERKAIKTQHPKPQQKD